MNKITILLSSILIILSLTSFAPAYNVGDEVADFTLKNTDGRKVSLSDFRTSNGIILIFDCNTCPYSKAYNSRIMALDKKYKSFGFPVVTINSNDPEMSPGDSFEAMVSVARRKKYSFPYLFDETQRVGKTFGATNTPQVFVLQNTEGVFRVAYIGAIDNNTRDEKSATRKYVEEAVDALLARKPVATPKTKAIGCGIKYRNR